MPASNHADRVHIEIALAGGTVRAGSTAGVLADDRCWAATSHGAALRPVGMSVPELMSAYQMGRIGLLKVDIEGGEFGSLRPAFHRDFAVTRIETDGDAARMGARCVFD